MIFADMMMLHSLIGFGVTLIWCMIGYCVKMSLEKSRARREQSDPNDLAVKNPAPVLGYPSNQMMLVSSE